ncbi:MAG: hypothetical protein ACP5NP_04820 [Acetobacteraceae bacterium]
MRIAAGINVLARDRLPKEDGSAAIPTLREAGNVLADGIMVHEGRRTRELPSC